MQCPPEVAEILGEILTAGLLRIRASDDIARCKLEADHLHNLPRLLADYKPELLDCYWTVERVSFIKQCKLEETGFEPLWDALAAHVVTDAIRAG
jgi:hypothetical protein